MASSSLFRFAVPQLRRQVLARGLRTTSANHAALPFTMPAMSPTMTEGSISSWKVKEGDSFVAGDILLEIETDKAQMDVEAQEDGIMAKILVETGAKGVPVGTRIAVLAEQGDDLSTLEIPAESSAAPAATTPSSPKQLDTTSDTPAKQPTEAAKHTPAAGKGNKGFHPSPSVASLLLAHNITDASAITGTGPRGRLLKGDVLAHLGKIAPEAPETLQSRFNKLAKLDLANIKIAAPKAAAPAAKKAAAAPPQPQDLAVEVSLAEIIKLQARLHSTVGTAPPLTTFFARAAAKANSALPAEESVDDLFNDLVGAPRDVRVSQFAPRLEAKQGRREEEFDVMDVLTGKVSARETQKAHRGGVDVGGVNVLRLRAQPGEVERAKVFLETVKGLVERQPEMLVL